MNPTSIMFSNIFASLLLAVACIVGTSSVAIAQPRPSIHQTTLEEPKQITPEVTTEELRAILASAREHLFDTRPAKEYAIAHIPGSVNLYEKEVERITESHPDNATRIVIYCNGPFCGKSKRVSEDLMKLGYTAVRRYQLGLPVWRALGNTAQTSLEGVRYILKDDKTAVFVDARARAQFEAGTVAGAVNVRAGEARKASDDGVLPYLDHGTRVVVFANSPQEARTVAEEIARVAYWNGSYFGGAYEELQRAGLGR